MVARRRNRALGSFCPGSNACGTSLEFDRHRIASWHYGLVTISGHHVHPQRRQYRPAGRNHGTCWLNRRSWLGTGRRWRMLALFREYRGGRRDGGSGRGPSLGRRFWSGVLNCLVICNFRGGEPEISVLHQDKAEGHQQQNQRHHHTAPLALIVLQDRGRGSDLKTRDRDLLACLMPLKLL